MGWKEDIEKHKQRKLQIAKEEIEKQIQEDIKNKIMTKKRNNLIIDDKHINGILQYIGGAGDKLKVKQLDIDDDPYLFDGLLDFEFNVECTYGDHRNDGQMVDYKITIKNPNGKKLVFETEMCLMVGWNVAWGDYDLKNMKIIEHE